MSMRRLAVSMSLMLLAAPALAAVQTETVEWEMDGTAFSGVLVYDDANSIKRPGVVMVPNWMGVTGASVENAKRIAGDDYVVLVADVYGKDNRPADREEAGKISGELRDDRELLRNRVSKAVEVLRAQAGGAPVDADAIAAIGFCFGGTSVLELARAGSDIAGVVSFHGGLSTPLPAGDDAVDTSILVLNGADDRGVSDEDIAAFEREMDAAGADWQFVNFSGAVHCFAEPEANHPPGCVYDERAATRAYEMMEDFLEERFSGAAVSR